MLTAEGIIHTARFEASWEAGSTRLRNDPAGGKLAGCFVSLIPENTADGRRIVRYVEGTSPT